MFRIEFSSKARKVFDRTADEKIKDAIKTLIVDPVPARFYDVKKIQGSADTFRIRVGKMRIAYSIIWKDKTILVFRIHKRGGAYD